jgi:hypothetical protein
LLEQDVYLMLLRMLKRRRKTISTQVSRANDKYNEYHSQHFISQRDTTREAMAQSKEVVVYLVVRQGVHQFRHFFSALRFRRFRHPMQTTLPRL